MESQAIYKLALPPLKLTRPEDIAGSSSVNNEEDTSVAAEFPREEEETANLIKSQIEDAFETDFLALRASCGVDETSFFKSLQTLDLKWSATGGKSGASISKTLDQKFLVKQISENEYRCFLNHIGPRYFHYLRTAPHTCLAKIFRVYKQKDGLRRRFMIVMENLTFGKEISVKYDLKGKLQRNVEPSEEVRFEEEFSTDSLCLTPADKQALLDAVSGDAMFLKDLNIMDYSLLVGVDKVKQEIVCGIIDYLVPYTAAKRLEWLVKLSMMTCICTNVEPTVLPPVSYMNRLKRFVEDEFKVQP